MDLATEASVAGVERKAKKMAFIGGAVATSDRPAGLATVDTR